MKMLTIKVVDRPKSFADTKFTEDQWEAAKKKGSMRLPASTAQENIILSRGLYEVQPEIKDVEVRITGPKPLTEMSNDELAMEAMAFGKPLRKQMSRKKVIEMLEGLREKAAENIIDDDE